MATGPHMRRIHGLNLPTGVILLASQMRPIVTSVNASTTRATIMTTPTIQPSTPMMSV